jgi:serine/threonine-protein kinase
MGTSGEPSVKAGDIVEGRYRIIKQIDDGGMGTVFLAEHVLIKRRVAIKILHSELAVDTEVIERFMNEASAAGTLGHPNIVESTDMGFTRDDTPFIVFEYLEGSLLTDEIYRVGGLPLRRALTIANQIASALEAAHQAGIVHRDLKSDNVFLTDREGVSDHVKVLDFGISRFLTGNDSSRQRKMVIGTPEFMAPEQIMNPEGVDNRTDVYALGVVLYEMLTARRPFKNAGDTDALLHQIVHEPPPPLALADAPPGLEQMILYQMLGKDPARRYQSMKEVEGALEAFSSVLRESQMTTPVPAKSTRPPTLPKVSPPARTAAESPLRRSASRRRLRLGWLAAAIVVAAAGVALTFVDTKPQAVATSSVALAPIAEKLGGTIDTAATGLHLRAEGLATSPILRAAIVTDAATVRDMAKSDFLLTPKPNETIEIFQLANDKRISLLRLPPASAPSTATATTTTLQTDGRELVIVTTAPVARQGGEIGGLVVLSLSVDLGPTRSALTGQVLLAKLSGLANPIVLVGTEPAPPGQDVSVPIPTHELSPSVVLAAVIAHPVEVDGSQVFHFAAVGCWVLAGALALIFLRFLIRRAT